MGDPAGVGPELCLRLLNDPQMLEQGTPIVFGDASVLRQISRQLHLAMPGRVLPAVELRQGRGDFNLPMVVDLQCLEDGAVRAGHIDGSTGRASFDYIVRAIDAALAGAVAAVCTAPINKEALHLAGIPFPGHTEIFADRTGCKRWCMMQYSPEITCSFVTVHVGYRDVPELLSVARILEVIELTHEGLLRLRGRPPRIVVCGLNPHAGEHGLFGLREEERFVMPAIAAARAQGLQVEGPLPPDTAFVPAQRRRTDAFVCLYHDQGHIPVKALAFDSAVNTTLGLPIVRTSVDHGTALDIAWQGSARPDSLFHAFRLALQLARPTPSRSAGPLP